MRYQNETEIYWHDTTVGEPALCYGGDREKRTGKWLVFLRFKRRYKEICSGFGATGRCSELLLSRVFSVDVRWSPLGHFLATYHKQGVALWAGPEFQKKIRFAHDARR